MTPPTTPGGKLTPPPGYAAYDTRRRLALMALLADIAEAALDQPRPTRALARALNRWLSYTKEPQRLKGDDA